MDQYITGSLIRELREARKLTQAELAETICVSDKTVSKWETGKGYPDISLLEPLAEALRISVIELMAGRNIVNQNRSFNMKRLRFYVCPVCGNVIWSTGDLTVSCCGITLPALEAEPAEAEHELSVSLSEDEYYITCDHPMAREHYISFIAAVKDNGCEIVKLYPEGSCEARFKCARTVRLYYYCNRHGLFRLDTVKKREKTGNRA